MSYQRGDARVRVGGRDVFLRLTLGALAEVCDRLDAHSPGDLAKALRSPDADRITVCAEALLRPVHGAAAQGLAQALPPRRAAPVVARLFAEGFA